MLVVKFQEFKVSCGQHITLLGILKEELIFSIGEKWRYLCTLFRFKSNYFAKKQFNRRISEFNQKATPYP